MEKKYKPCPFCGKNDIELEEPTTECFWVRCNDCGCQMWGDNSEKEAIERWNERKGIE